MARPARCPTDQPPWRLRPPVVGRAACPAGAAISSGQRAFGKPSAELALLQAPYEPAERRHSWMGVLWLVGCMAATGLHSGAGCGRPHKPGVRGHPKARTPAPERCCSPAPRPVSPSPPSPPTMLRRVAVRDHAGGPRGGVHHAVIPLPATLSPLPTPAQLKGHDDRALTGVCLVVVCCSNRAQGGGGVVPAAWHQQQDSRHGHPPGYVGGREEESHRRRVIQPCA